MSTEFVLAVQQMASHGFASLPRSTHIFSASFASGLCARRSVRSPLSSDGDRQELMHARSEFRLEYDVLSIRK
jgi:hypothetical protein